jgi:hypothetical protein
MQGLLHSLAYLWNQKLVDIPLSYEMFLLAHHEKKKRNNVSGKIVPNFYIGHRKVWVEIYFWQMSNRISISRLTYGKFSRYNVKFFFRFS